MLNDFHKQNQSFLPQIRQVQIDLEVLLCHKERQFQLVPSFYDLRKQRNRHPFFEGQSPYVV